MVCICWKDLSEGVMSAIQARFWPWSRLCCLAMTSTLLPTASSRNMAVLASVQDRVEVWNKGNKMPQIEEDSGEELYRRAPTMTRGMRSQGWLCVTHVGGKCLLKSSKTTQPRWRYIEKDTQASVDYTTRCCMHNKRFQASRVLPSVLTPIT